MNRTMKLPVCPACKQGCLHAALRTRTFHPSGKAVEVQLLTSQCDHCEVQTTRADQHDENLRRLAARKASYGSLLMGEEILSLRKRYGLTQQAAAKIFGKGKIAFSRYENEATFPGQSTTLLLRVAIEKPDVIKALADIANVGLPLWAERCEDAQRPRTHQPTKLATRKRTTHFAAKQAPLPQP
jgi:putative zinc finger/helix-turn-helix YgiT family protein